MALRYKAIYFIKEYEIPRQKVLLVDLVSDGKVLGILNLKEEGLGKDRDCLVINNFDPDQDTLGSGLIDKIHDLGCKIGLYCSKESPKDSRIDYYLFKDTGTFWYRNQGTDSWEDNTKEYRELLPF